MHYDNRCGELFSLSHTEEQYKLLASCLKYFCFQTKKDFLMSELLLFDDTYWEIWTSARASILQFPK